MQESQAVVTRDGQAASMAMHEAIGHSRASCEHFNSNTLRATTEQRQLARRMSLCLGATQGLALLLAGLEPSMAKLGGCVDELQLDVLKRPP